MKTEPSRNQLVTDLAWLTGANRLIGNYLVQTASLILMEI